MSSLLYATSNASRLHFITVVPYNLGLCHRNMNVLASCSDRVMPLHTTFETETSRLHYSAAAALLKKHTPLNCYRIKRQHRALWQKGTSSLKGCVCLIFIVPTPACEFCELMYSDPLRESVASVVRRIHGHSDPIHTQEAQILGCENAQAACASPTFTLLIPLSRHTGVDGVVEIAWLEVVPMTLAPSRQSQPQSSYKK